MDRQCASNLAMETCKVASTVQDSFDLMLHNMAVHVFSCGPLIIIIVTSFAPISSKIKLSGAM